MTKSKGNRRRIRSRRFSRRHRGGAFDRDSCLQTFGKKDAGQTYSKLRYSACKYRYPKLYRAQDDPYESGKKKSHLKWLSRRLKGVPKLTKDQLKVWKETGSLPAAVTPIPAAVPVLAVASPPTETDFVSAPDSPKTLLTEEQLKTQVDENLARAAAKLAETQKGGSRRRRHKVKSKRSKRNNRKSRKSR